MNGKVVAISITFIFAVALVIPYITDISKEEALIAKSLELRDSDIEIERINDSHASLKFIISAYRAEIVKNASILLMFTTEQQACFSTKL